MLKNPSKPKSGSKLTICVRKYVRGSVGESYCSLQPWRWRGKERLLRDVSGAEVWEVLVPLLRAASGAVSSGAEPGTPAER